MSRSNELADCVKRSLERYFKDMDGEKPTSIYEMVLKNIEKPMIETVLGHAKGNLTHAIWFFARAKGALPARASTARAGKARTHKITARGHKRAGLR